ncbi:MAG: TatD family hydrolase [Peptococcaceae bacterium]|nr:TatD family hydrolase [Peptococcaceae bacterium]MBQ5862555.1 TatD family hydrolase [Peptococcaceae bacterium]
MHLFDTHAHILDDQFKEDLDQVIRNIYDNMALVVNIGCNLEDCPRTVALAEQYDKLYAAVGLHPEDVKTYTPEGWDMICRLAEHPKVVGIGETGLDYYWDTSTKDAQKVLFEQHIDLAKQLHKPLVIHDREAHGDTLEILKRTNAKEVGGILHAFSGSVEMAMEVIKLGFYIGLGGPVTFKNARKAVEVAQAIPLEYLVIETDCPYMAPVPFRGKRNEPMLVQHTAAKIAELRGISVEELIEATYQNGKRIYGIE